MMWRIIEFISVAAIVLIAITDFFYPILAGKPLFGSFRKSKVSSSNSAEEGTLDEKLNKAKVKIEEVKNVQNEVDNNYKSAEQLKEESDKLLNHK